ncbi:unnamed protein product [Effrenium voratum]|nr:unnamed protein product [Effrenium voratum]
MFAVVVSLVLLSAEAGSIRGREEGRTIAVKDVQADLQDAMEAVLRGDSASKRVANIEARVWQTFQALPKNEVGRLAPRGVRYLVHSYFMKEHGWLIKGLDPHGNQDEVSDVQDASILQDKAPALVESLLEARRSNHGLALNDVITMIATLERLIFDESLTLLQAAYNFNRVSMDGSVEQKSVHDVLTSYLLLFQLGNKGNLTDARLHRALKARVSQRDDWLVVDEFQRDAVLNHDFAKQSRSNPFVEPLYTFQDSSDIVEELAHGYGKWQNTECRQMKDDLMELDSDGDGRIPIGKFYGRSDNTKYQFTESLQYLQDIGALDESGSEKKVRISNYLQGPSNCIASSTYYSICCLSECDGLLNELEAKIGAPTVDPMHLLRLVGNMSSSTVDTPRQLPVFMAQRLKSIADQNGGGVPLHGRLFSEWLHYAFPNECPYPHILEAKTLTPSHWANKKVSVEPETRSELASTAAEEEDSLPKEIVWSSQEVLHVQETKKRSTSVFRTIMQLAVLLAVLRAAIGNWATLRSMVAPTKGKKCDDFQLPF